MREDFDDDSAIAFAAPARTRRYVLAILTLTYTLAFIDRQIINILAEPIKRDMHLADWQMGAMSGLAFAALYTTLSLPASRLSERTSRSQIIAGALVLWSGFTALSGFAANFVHLLIARTGVGVGEAVCIPASHSLITDITPRNRRATALAIFSMGLPLGSLLGLALGGVAASIWGWRNAFFVVGVPGILLALVMLATIRDPRPSSQKSTPVMAPELPGLWATFTYLRGKRSFVWMTCATTCLSIMGYAHEAFYGSFFLRNHGDALDRAAHAVGLGGRLAFLGIALGLIVGTAGVAGVAVGGRLADRFANTHPHGYLRVPALACLIGLPFLIAAFLASGLVAAFAFLFVAQFLKSTWYGPVFASLQGLVDSRSRAMAVAIFLLFVNALGLGCGPILAGLLSDLLSHTLGSSNGLRVAMASLALLMVLSAICYARAARSLRADLTS